MKNNGSEIINPGKLKKGKAERDDCPGTVAEKEEGHGLQKDSTGNL